jgi:hypothetical protein
MYTYIHIYIYTFKRPLAFHLSIPPVGDGAEDVVSLHAWHHSPLLHPTAQPRLATIAHKVHQAGVRAFEKERQVVVQNVAVQDPEVNGSGDAVVSFCSE